MEMPTSFECDRCGYTTNSKQHLQRHLTRKTPCKPTNSDISPSVLVERFETNHVLQKEFECVCCQRRFTTSWTLSRHEKSCNKKKGDDSEQLKLLRLIAESMNAIVSKDTQVITNNNITNIQINGFGSEQLDYVVNDRKFMTDCVTKRESGIPMILERIHFHSKVMCNQNIRYDLKHKLLQIHDGHQWKYHSKGRTLKEMIVNASELYKDHFNSNVKGYTDRYIVHIHEFCKNLELYEQGKITLERVCEEVEIMLLNNSVKIHGTKVSIV